MAQAQPQFPPVPGNDVQQKGYGLWQNTGWVIDTDSQLREDVLFVSGGGLPRTFIRKEATISFTHAVLDTAFGGTDTLRRLDMAVVGAEALYPDALGSSAKIEERHFYLPHCGPTGVTNVVGYNRIVDPNVYPLIDLWVFSGTLGQKVMFVIWPGGDPTKIALRFTGQNQIVEDFNGWLKLLLEDKWISLPEPVAYQFNQSNTILPLPWTVDYQPEGNSGLVHLIADGYDPTKPLVFLAGPPAMGGPSYDEVGLCWSTYHGDNGLDRALDVRTDVDGNIYMAGNTSSTLSQFPADPGITLAASGNVVAFMTKFDYQHQLNWTLFYGGNVLSSPTTAAAIAIREEPERHIFLVGQTSANDLWCMANGAAYIDSMGPSPYSKGYILEITELGFPVWATYFGEGNMAIEGATITAANNLVICGYGYAGSDLPEVQYGPPPGSLDQVFAGFGDAFVAYFDPAGQLFMCSWFGGAQWESALVVRSVPERIVFAGYTGSGNIDMVDPGGGAFTQAYGGGTDCYLVELNENGVVQWSTYLGGAGSDFLGAKGLDIDKDGDVFLCGRASPGLQIVPGPNWCDSLASPNSMNGLNGFVARFSGIDRSPLWISYLGDGHPHMPQAIVHGTDDLTNVAGYTSDDGLPHVLQAGSYNQDGVYDIQCGAFLVQFNLDQSIAHATWFGGDAGTDQTYINALAPVDQGVYAVGSTHKFANPLAYFPLDDAQGMAWFDGDYNHLAQTGSGSDAFLTFFCTESGVGMNEASTNTSGPRVACSADGTMLLVAGLAPTAGNYRIVDMLGRMKAQGGIRSHDGTATIALNRSLSAGSYIIAIDGHAPLRFVRP